MIAATGWGRQSRRVRPSCLWLHPSGTASSVARPSRGWAAGVRIAKSRNVGRGPVAREGRWFEIVDRLHGGGRARTVLTKSPSRCGRTTNPPFPCTESSGFAKRATFTNSGVAGTASCGTPFPWGSFSRARTVATNALQLGSALGRQSRGAKWGRISGTSSTVDG
jgi:hypothetical protein